MASDSDTQSKTKVLPPRLATGQCLKHFQLESVVGEGGMGIVYRANDTQLCRPVAVKILPSELTVEPERKQRFLQEARAAARINHPAVAQIFYVDEQDGVTFIVMELVEGKTLRELIQGGGLDLLGVVDVVIQIAEGLAKAHELGIVHRDIKPANIMVSNDGHVKILDFGVAKLLDRGPAMSNGATPIPKEDIARTTLPGVVLGTAAYMSPEQVRGGAVDGRADIFSLGILLFEMATGQSPFQRESFVDSLHAVAFEEPPPLVSTQRRLPEELQQIISRCLRKRPEERYPDARLLARDLRELRRRTESGVAFQTNWRMRLTDALERARHFSPWQYTRFGIVLVAIGAAFYAWFAKVAPGGLIFPMVVALILYRQIRNGPHRMQEWFVRRTAKIPEVRLIVFHGGQFTVVVDRPVAQLYGRINQHLQACNRKLFFGEPMTVTILPSLSLEKTKELLASPGVRYVRHDILKDN